MTRRWRGRRLFQPLLLAALLLLGAAPAFADIGVPMLAVVWPASWLLLLVVIPLEAAIPVGSTGISYWKRLRMAAEANIASTMVGIPLTWGLLVCLQMVTGAGSAWGLTTPQQKLLAVTVQSPWLIPYEGDLNWMIPTAAAVLCVPFCLMSVGCEYLVARRFAAEQQRPQIWRWSWKANIASYALILLFLGTKALLAWPQRGGH